MTKILKTNEQIKCPLCGKTHTMTLYDSVNVRINPELKEKVFNREINTFPCEEGRGYLFGQFLYVDNDLWIWLYPEFFIKNKKKIESEMQEQKEINDRMFGDQSSNIHLVFGYEEFFKLLNKLETY